MLGDLRLQHFRSYTDSSFEFGPGVNIIVGPNGSGKTNLLEAVLLLCRGSSYRAADRELIQHKQPWARLEGHVQDQVRALKLQSQGEVIKKEYVFAGTTLRRLPHTRTIPAVVFEPNHLQLLTESPELRRGFLDDVIEQTTPVFGDLRRRYRRALAQRNSLLKQNFTTDQMFIWNVRLSELGGQIVAHRQSFVEDNRKKLASIYQKLADKKAKVDLTYQATVVSPDYSTAMLKALEQRLDKDRERGFTTIGPHRDDLLPLLNGYSLSAAASRGETRTMLLALK